MSCKSVAICLENIVKEYKIYNKPSDRLWAMFPWNSQKSFSKTFSALKNINLKVGHGEVVGIIGRNGAGKSTLLQIVAQTIMPSGGEVFVNGKIAALLELGSGFNPEFSGRENIYLSAAIGGLSKIETQERFDAIVAFSGIGDFIDQPVKFYSSGMTARLAFSVATSIEPEILIIDEALSVGDGAFARKSFERIMKLKENGSTILFCSHSLFQVESLCNRAIWIEQGEIFGDGNPKSVTVSYQTFLDTFESKGTLDKIAPSSVSGHAKFKEVLVLLDGNKTAPLKGLSQSSTLSISGTFISDPSLASPSVAVTISTKDGRIVSSAAAWSNGIELMRTKEGEGAFNIVFPSIALLKGHYNVGVYLFCERGIHTYDWADPMAFFELQQNGIEQGIVMLEHIWECKNSAE